ncbi:hypothetical protein QZH41_006847 [Actinostola sp. cb2023]|nr:hypothetical protein QZH41_006847 [Actinostola sp. cb2023]
MDNFQDFVMALEDENISGYSEALAWSENDGLNDDDGDDGAKSFNGEFKLKVNITKVEKRELLTLESLRYKELIEANSHLRGVEMDDDDEKDQLPVHLIIGANDVAKIRTGERLRGGRRGDPVAEFTRFGWTIMSPEADTDLSAAYMAINSTTDYEQLCD